MRTLGQCTPNLLNSINTIIIYILFQIAVCYPKLYKIIFLILSTSRVVPPILNVPFLYKWKFCYCLDLIRDESINNKKPYYYLSALKGHLWRKIKILIFEICVIVEYNKVIEIYDKLDLISVKNKILVTFYWHYIVISGHL